MSRIFRPGTAILLTLFAALAVPVVHGQDKGLKELQWSHAFDLACRKLGEDNITEKTKRWGVEAFRDNNTNLGVFISEIGSFALAGNFQGLNVPIKPSKGPKWLTGNDLPARKAGVLKFDKMTKTHSMELFTDPNTDNWLFITEQGYIATCNAKGAGKTGTNPKWVHSVDLAVRKGGVKEWKDADKFGVEVYRDGNTGNLIYVTEHGFIAIIPEDKIVSGDGKAPDWLHGLDLSCRKYTEKAFTKDTRKFGVEVYHDITTGNLIFISEVGSIAVMPAPARVDAPTPKAKEPLWTHGLNVKCRKFGKADFTDAETFGAEVFRDPNLNAIIYVNEKGYVTVMAAK